jgi:hypothetical protein
LRLPPLTCCCSISAALWLWPGARSGPREGDAGVLDAAEDGPDDAGDVAEWKEGLYAAAVDE